MTREVQFPDPEPDGDPDRPLFAGRPAGPAGPPAGRRIEIAGTPAPVAGPGPRPAGPPPGPRPPAPTRSDQEPRPATDPGPDRAAIGVLRGPGRTQDQFVRMPGAVAGPGLLALLGAVQFLAGDGQPLPLLVAAAVLLAGTAAVQVRSGGFPGGFSRPVTRLTVCSTAGVDTDYLLVGTPSPPPAGGQTVRRPRPPWWCRSAPHRVSRLDLLAGPDGPPVGVLVGRLPAPARLALWTDRAGWAITAIALLELARQVSLRP